MKLKLLLYLMFLAAFLNAQEPYRSLIISEVRLDGKEEQKHFEFTNVGDSEINLSEFKFGGMRPYISTPVLDVFNDPWIPEGGHSFRLPAKTLKPGESFVIAPAWDYGPKMYNRRVKGFEGSERRKQVEFLDLADLLIHFSEANPTELSAYPNVKDSISSIARFSFVMLQSNEGTGGFYLEHHYAPGDSAVVDQVNCNFDNAGKNFANSYDVAGVAGATGNSLLLRKFSIKNGNLDFFNARGVGVDDSEWMVIPLPSGYNAWRDLWWTVGNHGDYILNESTLESDIIEVNYSTKTITVPWGIRRLDDIMRNMVKKPGIAWHYHLNANREDSLLFTARTGDKLTIFVAGNTLQTTTFDIIMNEPDENVNIVVPKARINAGSFLMGGPIRTNTQAGIEGIDWPRVTKNDHGTDTITGTWFGLPHAMRTDTLLKYLEKPNNASWEVVFVDGVKRSDLKDGDILKVKAQNGNIKEYFIQVQSYNPSSNANLASITWPDIPNFYKGIFGWIGDTIPNFTPTSYNYRVQVPLDVERVPSLIAKTQDLNASVEVTRAKSLVGLPDDRTIKFKVIAEDDSVNNVYSVELVKEKDLSKLQPYHAEPFLSELVFWESYNNSLGEICNPGNQPLDLSNYMIAMAFNSDPASVIRSRMNVNDWLSRFDKYVPGYKWVSQDQWAVTPGILVQDLKVNAIVQPGGVFCLGGIHDWNYAGNGIGLDNWQVPKKLDVQFLNRDPFVNTWNEPIHIDGNPIRKWNNSCWYLFKILNDSIKLGLKPANDPNDFELIEAFGMNDGSTWIIGGKVTNRVQSYRRKPGINKGNPNLGDSFGTNPDNSEWYFIDTDYYAAMGFGWPWRAIYVGYDIGQHYMNEPTQYMSTINSLVYKVSEGYSMDEDIRGVITGTTVETFLGNIIKANEYQVLTVKSGNNILNNSDLIVNNNVLIVLSADSSNTSQYVIEVTDEGLSSDAVLLSSVYGVEITSQPKSSVQSENNSGTGLISGIQYGTQLRTIIQNVTVPPGASLSVINGEGAYVSMIKLNFDTSYVHVTVNPDTYFEVLAEDGITRIVYQLVPSSSDDDAFLLSDVYTVVQSDNLVHFVPRGTSVPTFMSNVIPSLNASLKVVDKLGIERKEGAIKEDDKIVVTSSNGLVTRVYHLSMLRTQYILSTTYLAYVLSDKYAIDQVEYIIQGPTTTTGISEFYTFIRPSMGATAVVVDGNGNEKSSGNLVNGDMLKVTSADGYIEVIYELKLTVVSSDLPKTSQIEIYPNPTSGKLNVRGAETGTRIQVYNASGAVIRDIKVQSNLEVLSIDNQPAGIYLIVIRDDNKLLGRYKMVKK